MRRLQLRQFNNLFQVYDVSHNKVIAIFDSEQAARNFIINEIEDQNLVLNSVNPAQPQMPPFNNLPNNNQMVPPMPQQPNFGPPMPGLPPMMPMQPPFYPLLNGPFCMQHNSHSCGGSCGSSNQKHVNNFYQQDGASGSSLTMISGLGNMMNTMISGFGSLMTTMNSLANNNNNNNNSNIQKETIIERPVHYYEPRHSSRRWNSDRRRDDRYYRYEEEDYDDRDLYYDDRDYRRPPYPRYESRRVEKKPMVLEDFDSLEQNKNIANYEKESYRPTRPTKEWEEASKQFNVEELNNQPNNGQNQSLFNDNWQNASQMNPNIQPSQNIEQPTQNVEQPTQNVEQPTQNVVNWAVDENLPKENLDYEKPVEKTIIENFEPLVENDLTSQNLNLNSESAFKDSAPVDSTEELKTEQLDNLTLNSEFDDLINKTEEIKTIDSFGSAKLRNKAELDKTSHIEEDVYKLSSRQSIDDLEFNDYTSSFSLEISDFKNNEGAFIKKSGKKNRLSNIDDKSLGETSAYEDLKFLDTPSKKVIANDQLIKVDYTRTLDNESFGQNLRKALAEPVIIEPTLEFNNTVDNLNGALEFELERKLNKEEAVENNETVEETVMFLKDDLHFTEHVQEAAPDSGFNENGSILDFGPEIESLDLSDEENTDNSLESYKNHSSKKQEKLLNKEKLKELKELKKREKMEKKWS